MMPGTLLDNAVCREMKSLKVRKDNSCVAFLEFFANMRGMTKG
jgi:hypothetical protein